MLLEQEILAPNHHAYLLFGLLPEDILTNVAEGRYVFRREHLIGVEDVRWLQNYEMQTVVEQRRVLLCSAPGITLQAQNALLKVMEELQEGVHFFLCIPPGTAVVATLRSRCVVLEQQEQESYSTEFAEFLSQTSAKRLEFLDTIWLLGEKERHVHISKLAEDADLYLQECIRTNKGQKCIDRCRKATDQLRDGIQNGALHKVTIQLLAFL